MKPGSMVVARSGIGSHLYNGKPCVLLYDKPLEVMADVIVPAGTLALVLRRMPLTGAGREWVRLLLNTGRCAWGLADDWHCLA